MSHTAHLWAIGYDDPHRAQDIREKIVSLAGPGQPLLLLDIAVVVRNADGSFTFEREPFSKHGTVGFLTGLALAAPLLSRTAVDAFYDSLGSSASSAVGIDDKFIRDVSAMIKPDSSALFVLDEERNMEAVLEAIRRIGGTVLRTNVDVARAKLIQATIANSVKSDKPAT
jgi:uncharacterized membrane protein